MDWFGRAAVLTPPEYRCEVCKPAVGPYSATLLAGGGVAGIAALRSMKRRR